MEAEARIAPTPLEEEGEGTQGPVVVEEGVEILEGGAVVVVREEGVDVATSLIALELLGEVEEETLGVAVVAGTLVVVEEDATLVGVGVGEEVVCHILDR